MGGIQDDITNVEKRLGLKKYKPVAKDLAKLERKLSDTEKLIDRRMYDATVKIVDNLKS